MLKGKEIHILIVEDDASMSDLLAAILKEYTVHQAKSANEALDYLSKHHVHITLLDLRLPDRHGLEVLAAIKESGERNEVIIISSVREVPTVVKAMKMGAYDYINKDFEYDDIQNLIARTVQKITNEQELLYLRNEISQYTDVDFLIGKSHKMRHVEDIIQKTAQVSATVLITGESGTGKELVARRIHKQSQTPDKPFVVVNLAAIPPDLLETTLFGHEKGAFTGAHDTHYGKFELANGGTIFLDEVGELRYDLQVKLLRALQESTIERVGGQKPVQIQVRVISATHRDLEAMVKEGTFREDLFYRLNVVPVHLPPLRDRADDIPDLVELFIRKYAKRFGRKIQIMTDGAMTILKNYSWPGNIRELENLIERLIAMSDRDVLNERDIPIEYLVYEFDARKKEAEEDLIQVATDAFERNFILTVLEKERWNQTKTAERLGIHRKTLEYKIKKLDLGAIIESRR